MLTGVERRVAVGRAGGVAEPVEQNAVVGRPGAPGLGGGDVEYKRLPFCRSAQRFCVQRRRIEGDVVVPDRSRDPAFCDHTRADLHGSHDVVGPGISSVGRGQLTHGQARIGDYTPGKDRHAFYFVQATVCLVGGGGGIPHYGIFHGIVGGRGRALADHRVCHVAGAGKIVVDRWIHDDREHSLFGK